MKAKTILIVDDDEDMLKILIKILGAQGMHIYSATGPEEAKKYLSEVPHVILTDLHMEPVDGFQFIRELKSSAATKRIPVLVLSALNDFASVKKALALGVSDYVLKPLTAQVLIRKINKVLFHQDFLRWDAEAGEEVVTEIEVEAKIHSLGETGYQLLGPFKMSSEIDLKVQCSEFEKLNLARFPQRASQLLKSYVAGGNFLNDVTFIGIDEQGSHSIRQFGKQRGQQ